MLTYIIIYVDLIKALLNAEVVAIMNFLGGVCLKGFHTPGILSPASCRPALCCSFSEKAPWGPQGLRYPEFSSDSG